MRVGVRMLRRAVGPLARSSTYARGVYVFFGGVVCIPYAVLAVIFVIGLRRDATAGGTALILALAVVAVVGGGAVTLLPGVRALEIVTVRALLGVKLPDPDPASRQTWEARTRGSVFYFLTLVVGGCVSSLVIMAIPLGVTMLLVPFARSHTVTLTLTRRFAPAAHSTPAAILMGCAGAVLLCAAVYLLAGAGALLARAAPLLLGPTQADQVAALRRQERKLAAGNRLARELHDSIGHALTAMTMQAGAAGRVLDDDPEFARRALHLIEETGRSALGELDQALGMLRRGVDEELSGSTLAGLDRLTAGYAGAQVLSTVTGDLNAVPPLVSREAFRVLQEALTNAVRHGDGGPIDLVVRATPSTVRLEVTNGVIAGRGRGASGRGLIGMRERVLMLGGELRAGASSDRWSVRATLPWPEAVP
ncbi:histidine kinase [Nocardia sp. CDC153]|uniref:sensor histidine kinase n=1 Tax=Nocardia sp. CDC153 TaxID=3112167 RepID=UPI002DBEFF32|nr:histidine kinase [Nocardia sp. CDC153]MEC3957901.1 histidine kinase [Nocardia sp. CDC153]